jgi:hypothetical protein
MCAIITLGKGQTFPYAQLKNATLNNPHGFGIVYTTGGSLKVYRKFDEKGNNPELVAKKLDEFKDADMRYLHLRYSTRGEKNLENTHPFTVMNVKGGRHIEFMHNGGLNRYVVSSEQKKSDSHQYAENFLKPVLSKWTGANGIGDIEDDLLGRMIDEHFMGSNRGLLIANDLDPLFLGSWKTFKINDHEEVPVSNDDYFDKTSEYRLTDFYKPKASDIPRMIANAGFHGNQTKSGASNETANPLGTATLQLAKPVPAPIMPATAPTTQTVVNIGGTTKVEKKTETIKSKFLDREVTPLKEVDLRKTGRFLEASDFTGIYDQDDGILDDQAIDMISYFSYPEFRAYVLGNPDGAARLLENIFMRATDLIQDNDTMADKKYSAEKRIEALVKELQELRVKVE